MGDYFPSAPVNDEARRRNGNLPVQGGVFNYVNLHAYHYAGNNPVKYVDPDEEVFVALTLLMVALFGCGKEKDCSKNLFFIFSFKHSATVNNIINENLANFKTEGISEKTYDGDISFYIGKNEIDLILGIAEAPYTMTIKKETKTIGFLFWKREVTEYTISMKISDTYDFDGLRDPDSLVSKLNNWGYAKQQKGDIKPFVWTFTYTVKKRETIITHEDK